MFSLEWPENIVLDFSFKKEWLVMAAKVSMWFSWTRKFKNDDIASDMVSLHRDPP